MPVPYYQGRPASLIIAVLSRHTQATAAKPAAPASPASPRSATQAGTQEEASSLVATDASTRGAASARLRRNPQTHRDP